MFEIAITLLLLGVVIVIMLRVFRQGKAAHFIVPTSFGKPVPKLIFGGITPALPWWDTNKYIWSQKLQTMKMSFSFFTKDDREVIVNALVRFTWNPYVLNEKGVPRVFYMAIEELRKGLESKLKSEMTRLGKLHSWRLWQGNHRAIENFLNCILRLPVPPHVNPTDSSPHRLGDILDQPQYKDLQSRLEDLGHTSSNPEIPKETRILFYEMFSGPIGDLLRSVPDEHSHSSDEQFYGIAIKDLTLDDVGFSPATKEAMEQEQRARNEIEGAELRHATKRKWAKELRDDNLDAQSAQDSAELNMGQAEKKIFSVEGSGSTPIILGDR